MTAILEIVISQEEGIDEIIDAFKQEGIYTPNLLYRAFSTAEDVDEEIARIVKAGTDRTSKISLGGIEDRIYDLVFDPDYSEEYDKQLNPSEYVWLAEEEELAFQIEAVYSEDETFVLVYDPDRMTLISGGMDAYAFKNPERPQDSLLALAHLNFGKCLEIHEF